jgi:hypothetical protein
MTPAAVPTLPDKDAVAKCCLSSQKAQQKQTPLLRHVL